MKFLNSSLTLVILSLLAGCGEQQADLISTKSHQSGSISFSYPGNWKITEDSTVVEIQNLFVETPGEALVILQSYPVDIADNLTTFSQSFSFSAADETLIGDVSESTFTDLSNKSGFVWIEEEFHMTLFGETIPHRRLFGAKDIRSQRIFLVMQSASEDYAKVEPGYKLIWSSLRSTRLATEGNEDSG